VFIRFAGRIKRAWDKRWERCAQQHTLSAAYADLYAYIKPASRSYSVEQSATGSQ
jgi:hypothetical protein